MEKDIVKIREIGQLLSIALASILIGSTLVLSAVGPARASEAPVPAGHNNPAALYYLA